MGIDQVRLPYKPPSLNAERIKGENFEAKIGGAPFLTDDCLAHWEVNERRLADQEQARQSEVLDVAEVFLQCTRNGAHNSDEVDLDVPADIEGIIMKSSNRVPMCGLVDSGEEISIDDFPLVRDPHTDL